MGVIELRAPGVTCLISPGDGGRIAQLTVDGRPLLVPRPDDVDDPIMWGCYPMVPWAGRVSNGRFAFDDHDYQLEINHPPHSIHGTGWFQPWSVREVDSRSVSMACALGDHWPFGGVAQQRIELSEDTLTCHLSVCADDLAMPAQVGWHPWFVVPDRATVEFSQMYVRDDAHIPTGALVAPPPGPWDDCFIDPQRPVELAYGDLVVGITSDCSHWVIYDQLARAMCVEPQSGPPNGFNQVPGPREAFTRLEPHESMGRTMTISWSGAAPR